MAPPRPHHHVAHHHHNHGGSSSGGGGSPFPPLGMAASGTVSAAFHNGPSNNTASGAETSAGLPPAPAKVDTNQAQEYRLQDAYWSDEDETMECPLCLEEIDISDANFKPCPCGYQICRFCWHHINQNLNGRCPACRRKYTDNAVEFKPMTAEEIKRLSQAKKQKEREKKELEQMNRKHLANVRVVQKNLVYVVGLDPKLAREELIPTLRSNDFFGQYGRISKVLISKRTTASKLMMGTTESAIGVYVTYVRKEDAARAIIAIDGSKGPDGKTIRASYGTTKYCTTYLRNLPCTNAICTYLHEPGEEADSFTKEDLTTLRHAAKDAESRGRLTTPAPASFAAGHKAHQNAHVDQANTQQQQSSPVASSASVNLSSLAPAPDSVEASALPKTASWASSKPGGAPPQASSIAQHNAIRDSDLPTLSASMARRGSGTQQQRASPAKPSIPTAPKGRTAPRPGSPAPSSPAAQVPPGLAAKPPPGLVPKGPSAMQRGRSESVEPPAVAAAPASNNASAPPPGLAKVASNGPPPGLPAPSRSATPSGEPVLSAPSSTSTSASPPSSYQPSSTAQALLDDMRARREAEADRPQKSAFSDLDAVLQSFQDGAGFSFTFEKDRLADKMGTDEDRDNEGYLGAFAPFAGVPSPGVQPLSVLGRGPGRGVSEPPTYSGSFDPFAPGAGESIEESPEEQQSKASPFAAIDEMRRTLSDERKEAEEAAVEEERESREDDSQADSPSKGASRFGFARRPDSETFVGTPSGPPSFKTHDDLLGFVRGGAAALTSNGHAQQDQAALQSQQQQQQQHPPHNDGQPDVSWLHADNRASYGNAGNVAAANRNAYKSMQANVHGQQQTRPGSSSLAMGNGHFGLGVNRSFGAGTPPPPGFGPRQQSGGPPGLMLQQQQQQQQQHVNGNASNDFLAQLQRGSAQGQASLHHLHQAQTPSSMDQRMNGGYFGRDQSTSNNVATGSSNEPPFAQLVAAAEARRAQSSYTVHKNASQGGGGIDGMPFSDPAIMSFARQQQQQHHQQQQQHHQQQQQHHHHHHQHQQQHQSQQGQHFGGGAGGGFSPFDSQQQMSNQHLPSWGGQEQQASWNGPFGSHQPYS